MFRFTIRDVLWLTVVVGLSIASWTQYRIAALWRSRATGAATALQEAERQSAWNGKGIVVSTPVPGTDKTILKAYSEPTP
jgi:hypothetical protein